jgi:hypothetical protein
MGVHGYCENGACAYAMQKGPHRDDTPRKDKSTLWPKDLEVERLFIVKYRMPLEDVSPGFAAGHYHIHPRHRCLRPPP